MTVYWQARDADTAELLVERLELATTFWTRWLGLQGRRPLPPDVGLLIAPCRSIHTCFVRFPLDVVFLDRAGVVLETRARVNPWRVAGTVRAAWCVLERTAGAPPWRAGTRLALVPPRTVVRVPRPLSQFAVRTATQG